VTDEDLRPARYTIQARFVWVPMGFAILVTTMIIGLVAADILVDVVTRQR
jgi:hypothetical protein